MWKHIRLFFLFLLIFVPLIIPSRALQTDEIAHWIERTDQFWWAISHAQFTHTVQTEHPGITVVAFAGAGKLLARGMGGWDPLTPMQQIYLLRLPLKLVNAMLIVLGYVVMQRLFTEEIAFFGALLWATSPYLRWHMRLLHIDGMTTNFMFLSLLLMLLTFQNKARFHWRVWVLAGFVGGLATLTRFSSLYLAGMAGLVALLHWRQAFNLRGGLQLVILPAVVYLFVVAITWTTLYPGMWTNAVGVYDQTLHGVDNAVSPHGSGNFFNGQAVDDPGGWFYPVVLWLRLTPFTMGGLLIGTVALFRGAFREQWRVWAAVGLYALLYLVMLTVLGKKFDRYLLPIYPALDLLAAFDWAWLIDQIRWQRVLMAIGIVLIVLHSLWYIPNEYAYVNPLAGAGQAQHLIMIGGGEGLQSLEAFFSDKNACEATIAVSYTDIVNTYLPCVTTLSMGDIDQTNYQTVDYYVRYINRMQRRPHWQAAFAGEEPIFTGTYNGIPYIEIFTVEQLDSSVLPEKIEDD